MICPLHGSGGHVDFRAPPTPPPQLAAVAGYRCRSRNTSNERPNPNKNTPSNGSWSTPEAVANDLPHLTEGRTFSPGYGWAEPGKGWTRCSYHAGSGCCSRGAGTGACPRHDDTRRVFKEIHVHSEKTPLSKEVDPPGRSYRVPPDTLQSSSKIKARGVFGGDRARDTAWAMSYLSRENSIPRSEGVLRNAGGKELVRRGHRQKHQPANSSGVETFTRSRRRSAADLVEARVMNHKLDSARMYNKELRDSNNELARQVVALRRRVEAVAAPTCKNARGRPACAESKDEHGRGGRNTGRGARVSKSTMTDTTAVRDRTVTTPQSPAQNDSPQGIERCRRRARGVPVVEGSTLRRLDISVSHHPPQEAPPAQGGSLPDAGNAKRAPARAENTRTHVHDRTRLEAYAEARLEAHAETQTEAVGPVVEDGGGFVAVPPHRQPGLHHPEKSGYAHVGGSLAGRAIHSDSQKGATAVCGGTGAIAPAHPSPAEHAGGSTDRVGPTGGRRVLAGPSSIRESGSYPRNGSEPEEDPGGGAGTNVKAKMARDHATYTSVCGRQLDEDGFESTEAASSCLTTQKKCAKREDAARAGGVSSDDEESGPCPGSSLDAKESGRCCNAGADRKNGNSLPVQAAVGVVSWDAATPQEKEAQDCSIASLGGLACPRGGRNLPLPLFEGGSGMSAPLTLASSPKLRTSPWQGERRQAPRASPARKPAVQCGAYAKRSGGETWVEPPPRAEPSDDAIQEEVERLQRELLDANHAVAAFKIALVLKRFTQSHKFEDAGIGFTRLAAICGGVSRVELAFTRWRKGGVADSSSGVDASRKIWCLAKISSPEGNSFEDPTAFHKPAEAAAVAAAGSISSENLFGGFSTESTFPFEKRESKSVGKVRNGQDLERDENTEKSTMESPSRRMLYPPTPPMPRTPRSWTDRSNIPLLPTTAAPRFVVGTEGSRTLVGSELSPEETAWQPETSASLMIGHHTAKQENWQENSHEKGMVWGVSQVDGGPATDHGSRDDRAKSQTWCASERAKASALAVGEDVDQDERKTLAREANEHGGLSVTVSSAGSGRQEQAQGLELNENGRPTVSGLGQVGSNGRILDRGQGETAAAQESGGGWEDKQSALPPPSPLYTTVEKAPKDAECSLSVDNSATKSKQLELEDVRFEGMGSWDRQDDQIRAESTADDKRDEGGIDCPHGGGGSLREKCCVEKEVGVWGGGARGPRIIRRSYRGRKGRHRRIVPQGLRYPSRNGENSVCAGSVGASENLFTVLPLETSTASTQ